jgi:hypothetical protein
MKEEAKIRVKNRLQSRECLPALAQLKEDEETRKKGLPGTE